MANILANITVSVVYIFIVSFWLTTTYRLKARVKTLEGRVSNLESLVSNSHDFLTDEEYDIINGDSNE